MGLRWGVGAGFIALNSYERGGGCFLGGAVLLRLLSAVDLVLVADGERRVGENVAGMAEQNESGVWGLIGDWGGDCTVGEFGSHPCILVEV